MRRLVIHIGTEKTGTTSLQHFFYLNEPALATAGVALLHTVDEPNNRKVATYAFMRHMHEAYDLDVVRLGGPQWREKLRADVRNEIEHLPAHIHTVLLTSEHLHSRLHSRDEVSRVAEMFKGLFDRIEVLVYLRRQDKLAASLYSTALRGGWTQESPFPSNVDARNRYYNYQELLERWASVFGAESLRVRRFEPSRLVRGSLYSDFLTATGLAELDGSLSLPPNLNESLPATVATAVLRFNQAMAQLGQDREGPRAGLWRRQLIQDLSARYPGPGLLFCREQAREFCLRFAASNAAVSTQWFGGEDLFDANFDSYPEQPAPTVLSQEVLSVIFASLFHLPGNPGARAAIQSGTLAERLEALPLGVRPPVLLRRIGRAVTPELPALGRRLQNIARALPEDWQPALGKIATSGEHPAPPKNPKPMMHASSSPLHQPATPPKKG